MAALESKNGEEDWLDEDKPIPGQNFCCLSFISPDKVLEKKDSFVMKRFIKSLENEDGTLTISHKEFDSKYDDFVALNSAQLDADFTKEVGFQTSVRGVKIRGVYNTYEEATRRAETLQKLDRSFHVFVGQVGYWLPWDPNADNIQEQEYLEKELNELMKSYKANQVQKDMFYSAQVEEHRRNAALDSQRKKDELKKAQEQESNTAPSADSSS